MEKVYCKYCKDFPTGEGRELFHTLCRSNSNEGDFFSPDRFKLMASEKNKNNDCPDFRDRRQKTEVEKMELGRVV